VLYSIEFNVYNARGKSECVVVVVAFFNLEMSKSLEELLPYFNIFILRYYQYKYIPLLYANLNV
jgi:hypothetical protein